MSTPTVSHASTAMRLEPQPGEVIDRRQSFPFTWNGRTHHAHPGDTIVSALAAAGERVFSRSFKYHRPRGVLTASFHDPGCMLQVDDEPNVRGAHRLAAPGMRVQPQNVWPSLRFDLKAANQAVGRFLAPGFYYKTFIKPQRLWPAYESVLRSFSNGGVVSAETEYDYYDKRYAHPDVLVAGGGPAGMAAALTAAETGAQVLLVEEEHQLGGHLRWGNSDALETLRQLREQVAASPSIEVMTNSAVLGRYDDNWIAVAQRDLAHVPERLVKARAKTLVVAAGLIERPYVFSGNDLPGVMLSTACRRLINLHAVKPGTRAVVFTANDEGDAAVDDLQRAGVEVAHVEDARHGGELVRTHGRGGLEAVEMSHGRKIEADLLVTATGWTAATALLNMAGDRPVYDPRAARYFPDTARLPENVLATGGLVGDGTVEQLIEHGNTVGRQAAQRAARISQAWRAASPTSTPEGTTPAGEETTASPALPVDAHPQLFHGPTHGMVDFSEDVASKEIATAVGEGYDSAELLKRYTTATMGPTQGKLEVVNTVAIVAELTGQTIAETGTTTWRPPYAPVTLGAMAGRIFEPVRYSPMHTWHQDHGATPMTAGAWIRPEHYGDPAAEVRNVRDNVSLIDVTPIGKLDLQGPDVPKLLNLLYVNKWSKLAEGHVRYGAMCAEDGVVFDDGVTAHLGPDHYLMSTTSGGAATVWEWVEHWLQTQHPDWQVHVTPLTTAYASINIAGPKSRHLMQRVTDGIDLSAEEFPYMRVRTGRVAGVDDCFVWRIGFTGELSYELHVPAGYGLHVWETLMQHGRDLGIGTFGVEAQRILRLEKGHPIVGQDTDGLTKGFSAGLDGLIKLDKHDFVGQPELAWQQESGDYPRLVGLQPLDGAVVPDEASQIVTEGEHILGRVTSSRMSPTLGRAICLAQVAASAATPGTTVTVRLPDGRHIPATVQDDLAHFDPKGERLRV